MPDKYLEAESYIEGMEIKFKKFILIEDGEIKRKFNEEESKYIVQKAKEFNKRINPNLKKHTAYIKDVDFVNYIEKYNSTKKVKNGKRRFRFSPKWWAFFTAATIAATLTLNNKNGDVSANENETIITVSTEESKDEEIKPVIDETPPTIEDKIEIVSSENSSEDKNIFEEKEMDTTMVYSSFEDIFQYSAENLWSDYYDYVNDVYGPYLDKYCPMYGMDKNLAIAIIAQENPLNTPNSYSIIDEELDLRDGGYGPGQEENVHNGEILYSHNLQTGEVDYINDYVGTKNDVPLYGVDVKRCETDIDYAVKIIVMRFMYNTNYLYGKENFELSDSQFIHVITDAYNKGVYGVEDSVLSSSSYEEVINANKNLGGDPNYGYNVFKRIKDGTEITITTKDGVKHSAIFDNTNVDEFKVDSSGNIKTMAH